MVRKGFIAMDDRLWTPEEWAMWLRYVEAVNGRNKTAVLEQKDSRFVKTDTKS